MKSVIRALPLCLAVMAVQAHAQSVSPSWNAYRKQQAQSAAQPVPQQQVQSQSEQASTPVAAPPATRLVTSQPASEQPALEPTPRARDDAPRSAFFVGVQKGHGWIYDDKKQELTAASAGFRWQAGPVTQVGIEAAYGKLKKEETSTTEWDPFWQQNFTYTEVYPQARYFTLGASARFNFGSNSPIFGIARLGYFRSKIDSFGDNDQRVVVGAYAGLGLGVDITRHFNVQLIYNSYVYSDDDYYDYYGDDYTINRADTATLGLEVRF